jgi:hypothetical protein
MKYFEKYFDNFLLVLAVFLGLANFNNAQANNEFNLTVGPLPTSLNYGNSFAAASTGTTFYDAYYFTIPDGSANSITSTISFGTSSGLNDLRARLYAGNSNPDSSTVVPGQIVGWGTTATLIPGLVTTETVVLNPVVLSAGTYTLQIKGTVTGTGGGSYAGVLNLSPVPEVESYAMFLAGLGLMGVMSRRRKLG